MPRYNVQHPKTKEWACYSTTVGNFITEWMDEEKYDLWRRKQYGQYYCPISEADQKPYEEIMKEHWDKGHLDILKEMLLKGYKMDIKQKYELYCYITSLEEQVG